MRTALYRCYADDGTLLYVGVTFNAICRLNQHIVRNRNYRADGGWTALVSIIEVEHFATREMALAAEERAIQRERPTHNIVRTNGHRKVRDIGLQLALAEAGGPTKLAKLLGLVSIDNWDRVPEKYLHAIAQKLNIPARELRPDLLL